MLFVSFNGLSYGPTRPTFASPLGPDAALDCGPHVRRRENGGVGHDTFLPGRSPGAVPRADDPGMTRHLTDWSSVSMPLANCSGVILPRMFCCISETDVVLSTSEFVGQLTAGR